MDVLYILRLLNWVQTVRLTMDLYGEYPQSAIVRPTAIFVGPTSLTNFGFKNCWTWKP